MSFEVSRKRNLTLTIRIEDSDNPGFRREKVVEANNLWDAIYELKNVAGPSFVDELMGMSWQYLTRPMPPPDLPDMGVTAKV